MTQRQVINDREYILAGEVGRHFGYTRDYVLMLVREGKIDGQKIGHRWYVNLESAEAHFASAKVERDARREAIREVRKAELRSHEEMRRLPSRSTALLETAAIMLVGLLIGVTGYLGVRVQQDAAVMSGNFSFFEQLAISLYDLISPVDHPDTLTPPGNGNLGQTSTERTSVIPHFSDAAFATTTFTSLVVGPGDVLTTTAVESIRDSFSDEVSVSIDPQNPDTGIIIPHFKNGEGEAYRFLMVPVTQKPRTQ